MVKYMKMDKDTQIELVNHIDIVKTEYGYRLHDYVSGVILKINPISAYIIKILSVNVTFEELIRKAVADLGEYYIHKEDIKELIINLNHLGLIKLKNSVKSSQVILLINPCYEYKNSEYKKVRITPPLGILSIGSVLQEKNFNIHLLDMLVEELRPENLDNYIKEINPNIVGISMNFTSTANVCYKIAKILKELSVKYVFVGGNHATFTYEQVLHNKNIDFVVRFHGEETVPELIDIIQSKNFNRLKQCKGIAFRQNDEIIVTPRREIPLSLNHLPMPAWNLLPLHKYSEDSRWVLYTSQGCPCACTFCSTSSFNNGNKVISMDVSEIIKRIKFIIKFSLSSNPPIIGFCDDAFTYNRERIVDLCNNIIKENLIFSWGCSTRVDLVDESLIELMYKAGCRTMLFGIESCNPRVLKAVGKKINLEQAKKAISIAKNRGIKIREMFILGLPFENEESIDLIEDFFATTNPDEIRFGLLSVYPGTPLWKYRKKFGINILTTDWGQYDLLKPTSNNTILSEEYLYKKYLELTEKYEKQMLNEEIRIM